ncbi:MAG: hypothetical protein FJ279_05940 [Planctomycetes bacterium]|nr:hypothetical protein [Planctomycetota bacterium]
MKEAVEDIKRQAKKAGDREFLGVPLGDQSPQSETSLASPAAIQEAKKSLELDPEDSVLYYTRPFSDKDQKLIRLVGVVLSALGVARKVGIFRLDDGQPIVVAEVLGITETGLVQFQLSRGSATTARDVFGVVRDLYHEHVYTPTGDFALLPVAARNQAEGIAGVWSQYEGKVILYHKWIRQDIEEKLRKSRVTVRTAWDMFRLLSSAQGEMVYGLSFGHLHDMDEGKMRALERSLRSFQVLESEVRGALQERGHAANVSLFVLTAVMTLLVSYQVFQAARFTFGCALSFSTMITVVVLAATLGWCWWTTRERKQ